jgi:hypothetical protein
MTGTAHATLAGVDLVTGTGAATVAGTDLVTGTGPATLAGTDLVTGTGPATLAGTDLVTGTGSATVAVPDLVTGTGCATVAHADLVTGIVRATVAAPIGKPERATQVLQPLVWGSGTGPGSGPVAGVEAGRVTGKRNEWLRVPGRRPLSGHRLTRRLAFARVRSTLARTRAPAAATACSPKRWPRAAKPPSASLQAGARDPRHPWCRKARQGRHASHGAAPWVSRIHPLHAGRGHSPSRRPAFLTPQLRDAPPGVGV